MKRILERELKFDVDPGFALPDLGGRPIEPRVFTSTYHDTADRRLFACGITLRRRVENRAGVWQLKLPSEGGRFELEEPGGPTRVRPSLLDLLPALLRGGAALEPVAKLRTRRAGVRGHARRRDGSRSSLDSVAVLDGTRVASTFAEIEAEVVAGDGTALQAIGKELRRRGPAAATARPKLARVLAVDAPAPAPLDETEPLTRLRSLLVEQYERAARERPRSPARRTTSEALHQARVATRRARALLRAGARPRRRPSGPSRCAPSSRGWAACSARSATSTSCSSTSTPRRGCARGRRRRGVPAPAEPPRRRARRRAAAALLEAMATSALLRPARRARGRARRPGERRAHDLARRRSPDRRSGARGRR